ncbi:MAG: hypothetical protein IJ479_08145 [Alphaproteobacteria bacterium]|nr:hypothetical protein [Alphaproteobacteria bacterium]
MAKPTKNQKANNTEDIIRKRLLEILGAYFDENGGFPESLPKDIANEILRISKLAGKEQKNALRQFEDKYPSKQVESERWAEKINKGYKKNLNSGKDNVSGSELGKSFEKLKTRLFYDAGKEKNAKEELEQAARLIQELQTSLNTFINSAITEYKKQYPDMDEDIAVKDYQQRFADKISGIMNESNSLKDLKQQLTTYLETIKQVTSQLKTITPKEDKTMTEEKKPMTEEEKQNIVKEMELRRKARENLGISEKGLSSGVDSLEEKLIKSWADKHQVVLTHEVRDAAIEHLKSHSNLDGFMADMPEKEVPQERKKLKLDEMESPAVPEKQPQEEKKEAVPYDEQLQGIKEHWEKWCAETKDEKDQPLRNFKEIPNEDGFLKFEIEPTEALKAQNPDAKGAEVTYYSETEATMPMTDYDYFHQMAKAAKEVSHADVIECGEIKTPGYATRLIAAAYANGLDVENAPDKLDLSNETLKGIPDETVLTVLDKQIFNRDSGTAEKIDYDSVKDALRVYKDIQERAKDENGNARGLMESLDVSKMRFTDEAAKNKTIAAALEMGLKIEGVDKLNLNQETKEGIPEEAARLLGTMQVGLLRAKAQKLHDPNTPKEERDALKTEKMKQFDEKDKKALIQKQIETLRSKDATKAEKDLAGVRLDTLQGKRWEPDYKNQRNLKSNRGRD